MSDLTLQRLYDHFGQHSRMAHAVSEARRARDPSAASVSAVAVQKWFHRRKLPLEWLVDVAAACTASGLNATAEELAHLSLPGTDPYRGQRGPRGARRDSASQENTDEMGLDVNKLSGRAALRPANVERVPGDAAA